MLSEEDFEHLKVNHSLNFKVKSILKFCLLTITTTKISTYLKDPETGAHTNNIESSWRAAKAITTPSSRRKAHIPGNLARYMFNKRCLTQNLDRTAEFFRLAGKLYDPTKVESPSNMIGDEETDSEEESL